MRKMIMAAAAVFAVAAPAAASNLVSNGSFEAGLNSWSAFPNDGFAVRNTSQGFAAFHGANYLVGFADEGYRLEQQINTQIGAFYVVSFRFASQVTGESIGVFFDNMSGGIAAPSVGNSWELYSAAFQATSTASYLQLEFYNGYNDLYVDDVSVTVLGPDGGVPEPASWAMLIAGFGLTGAAMRRRRSGVRAA